MSILDALDPPVVIAPSDPDKVRAAVVWLHGLGADGNDFVPVAQELVRRGFDDVRFIFPHAPLRKVTINGGMEMRAWYDIVGADLDRGEDGAGVRESARIASALVEEQMALGIEPGRIVLAGFSQGGAIALHAALRFPRLLAGVLALSTYLPLPKTVADEVRSENRDLAIFLAHGSEDPIIPLALSDRSCDRLAEIDIEVETHTYPMPHSVCPEEIRDIANWLGRVL
ncbi:alpha/beta hydrolase [Thioalkalivibrio sp. HK1]|uniref:alpha/beta hydrolase n=1 Tax=Thioalkalivibrio sp. HK1 TaxID=1469245 RepID=UPI0004706AF5|nr:dienelactone hydrolase family protein [Thioalkalivibrio sp. HK1]